MHRHLPVEIAAKHLFVTKLINDFIIFNAYASEEEFQIGNVVVENSNLKKRAEK
ncbi:hypothetical protein RV14_GL000681 [Enterococcus ratti]|uniref:6-phospho-N-acetylmuramidase N-terminal domain-containing protein n=1 Tax=Enterococcus ratti TaxID=150033 RepID=A0A1L8WGX2_9ENTE|nr:hypothetical protein RV14_GL000681 [Enterococcus ratti]